MKIKLRTVDSYIKNINLKLFYKSNNGRNKFIDEPILGKVRYDLKKLISINYIFQYSK